MSSSRWQNQSSLAGELRKAASSACILQQRADRLWSEGQPVSTISAPVAFKDLAREVEGGASVKRCTERPASGNQVANKTGSRELCREPEVFTEMNTSDNKTGEGTGDASPKAIKPIIRAVIALNIVSLFADFDVFLFVCRDGGHHHVFPLRQLLLY